MTGIYEKLNDVLEKEYSGKNGRSKCPFHDSDKDNSFQLFRSGVGKCWSSCSKSFSVPEMGVQLKVDTSEFIGITVDQLLTHCHFPFPELLKQHFSLEDKKVNDKPCVAIPYFDTAENGGQKLGEHIRHTLTNDEGQKWSWSRGKTKGIGSIPYQINRYRKTGESAFIVEGETDVWTLNSCKFTNVIGFAGGGMFSPDVHKHLVESINNLYVWAERDAANDRMLSQVLKVKPDAKVLKHDIYKDPTEWLQSEGIEAVKSGLLQQVNNPTTIEEYFNQNYLDQAKTIRNDPVVKKLLGRGDIFKSFKEDIKSIGYVGDTAPALACYIAANSRGSDEPINVYLSGASSVGKTFTAETVLEYIPESGKIEIGSATRGSWAHTDDDYQDKILLVGEIDNLPTKEADDPIASGIRELLAKGRFKYQYTATLPSGEYKVIKVDKGGNMALITTGVRAKLGDQLDTRFMSYEMSHDEDQSRAIADHVIAKNTGLWVAPDPNNEPYKKLGGLLNYLSNAKIVIPFIKHIYDELPETYTLEHRFNRDFPKIATALGIVAKIRALAVEQIDDPIEVTVDDYAVVYEVFGRCITSASGSVTIAQKRVLTAVESKELSQPAIAKEIGKVVSTVNQHVKRLEGLGYLKKVDLIKPYRYTQTGLAIPEEVMLPTPDRLIELLETEPNSELEQYPNTDGKQFGFGDSAPNQGTYEDKNPFEVHG